MKVQKAFVKTNDTASIKCPGCELVKNVAVGRFRRTSHTLKINCGCNCKFMVALDFRKHYRKQTKLDGMYTLIGPPTSGGGKMQIFNISRSGVGFSVSGFHNINVGQKVLLYFNLDNTKNTKLTKEVVVRTIDNNFIGCEFLDQTQIGKDLGFYLRPC